MPPAELKPASGNETGGATVKIAPGFTKEEVREYYLSYALENQTNRGFVPPPPPPDIGGDEDQAAGSSCNCTIEAIIVIYGCNSTA